MKIFVVSLKDSPRRSKIKGALEGASVSFEFFDAVDARKNVPPKYEKRINRTRAGMRLLRPMSEGEFGCALSHALLYEKIVQENISDAIILEDDAIVTDDFFRLVKENLLTLSKIEMAFLYHCNCYAQKKKRRLSGLYYQKVAFMPNSTAGYYIKLPVAKALQKATQTISYVADFPIALDKKFYTVAFTPRFVKHPIGDENHPEILNKGNKKWSLKKHFIIKSGLYFFLNGGAYGSPLSYIKRFYLSRFFDGLSGPAV